MAFYGSQFTIMTAGNEMKPDSLPEETAGDNSEEGGDDVKSSCPLWAGLHTCYNGANRVRQDCEVKQITKMASQFGL